MTAPRSSTLPTAHIGRHLWHFDCVGSTNDLARQHATDLTLSGLAILADAQDAGRGQYDRVWTTPPGAAVLLSVLLHPPPALRQPAVLTAWAAVAVSEAVLELIHQQARIKWPNDVLLAGRKVCGILLEAGPGPAVIVGIGLNVNQTATDFAAARLPTATSLALATGQPFAPRAVAQTLLTHLDAEYASLLAGDTNTLEACWKWRLGLLGRPVRVDCHDGSSLRGSLRDVRFTGVRLDTSTGEQMLASEAIRHLVAQ